MPRRQCATACCSHCSSDTMPCLRRADFPQPAAATAPWTWCYTANQPMGHSPLQPPCSWSRLLRSCTSASDREMPPHRARSAMATCVSSRYLLCPTLVATTTAMLNWTAMSLSERVATCGGAAMSTTATTTTTMASHSSLAWKGLGVPNSLMFQVGT